MYRTTLERFEGPLDLLLQLIEQEKLDISEISLGKVTEQYLAYLDANDELPPEEMADFLVIAARLILLKSRLLLPELFGADEEDTGADLTRELALYRMYMEAGKKLDKRYRSRQTCFARERVSRRETVSFSPPPSLAVGTLETIYRAVLTTLEEFVRPAPELIRRAVSLKEKIFSLRQLFQRGGPVNFHSVITSAKDRMEVIVSFLALLELVKQRVVVAAQDQHNSHIVITNNQAEAIVADIRYGQPDIA